MLSAKNMGKAFIESMNTFDKWNRLNNFNYTRFKMSKLVSVIGPVGTRSGYGSHARDIVLSLLDLGYDVKTLPIRWENSSKCFWIDKKRDKRIIDTLVSTNRLDRQPDIHFHVSVPVEFQQVGKFNIGVTAGVEWTLLII